jgi:hypothetical protein
MTIEKKAILPLAVLLLRTILSFAQSNTSGATGSMYLKHENIDIQREMIAAMENHKFDEAFGSFIDKATVGTANFGPEAMTNSAGSRAYRIKFHAEFFDEISMDLKRPSIYIENENGKGGDLLSWYVFQLVGKSDMKEIAMPIHMIDSFNEDGKIIAEFADYSNALIYPGGKIQKND